jgi:hypothetical protein
MLLARRLDFVPVMLDVQLRRFGRVMGCMVQMSLSCMGVVGGLFVVSSLVMFRGVTMVPAGMFQVLSSLVMMFRSLF